MATTARRGLSELCSGERFVVALFLSHVLLSASGPFPLESLAISFLALSALAMEISADRSPVTLRALSTRPGASSGLLLGAVTLPMVMLSRLIQLSRYDAELQELSYLRIQYWTVSSSCFGALIFVNYAVQKNSSGTKLPRLPNFLHLVSLGLYIGAAYLSPHEDASYVKVLWLVSHGLASAGLIWHILRTFPLCASIGEALLVSGCIVSYCGDMVAYTLSKINLVPFSFIFSYSQFRNKSEISTIIQGLLFGLLLVPLVYKFILQFWDLSLRFLGSEYQSTEIRTARDIGKSILFYASFGAMVAVMAPIWMQFVKDFDVHPILWIFNFVFADSFGRFLLCLWWILIIFATVIWFYNISKHSKIERILLRKYYHLVAVVMFSPAVVIQPEFLDLAFGVAFSVFLALEMIRVWKIWPFGELIDRFMNAFTDHRDSEVLIISHFSLLLGCAVPKWMSYGLNDRPLAPFAGILSLGIGDTMASVVGHKYGTLRWSKSGKKTVEGTAAGITSVLMACSILLTLSASTGYIISQHWFSLLLAVTASGLLEAYTKQLDNAFIPLVFYSLLCL